MKRALTLIAVSLVLWGCGPEQTTKDKEDQQMAVDAKATRDRLSPAVGVYVGTLTAIDGNVMSVRMTLGLVNIPYNNPARSDVTTIPALLGSMEQCMDAGCFDTPTTDQTSVFTFPVTSAKYTAMDNYGNVVVTFDTSAVAGKPQSMTLVGKLVGNHLVGNILTSNRPANPVVDMQRISKVR